MKTYKNLAVFVLGTVFGSAGFRTLKSKDAKAFYTELAAAGLRAKDTAMDSVTAFREEASDIMAAAKQINADRLAAEEAGIIEDTAE